MIIPSDNKGWLKAAIFKGKGTIAIEGPKKEVSEYSSARLIDRHEEHPRI